MTIADIWAIFKTREEITMHISGIQKLTLLDYPGKLACTIFTDGCNFRCPFCHNAPLVLPEREKQYLSEEAALDFLKKRQGILEGVAVTGGEPTLQADLEGFLEKLKALGYKVKLDTNGTRPEVLKRIIENGLADKVAMDIKDAPENYRLACGASADILAVESSKELLLCGTVEYEFRTTVVKGIHTKESLLSAAKWIKGAKEYYLQQFKDSGDIILPKGLSAFDEKEMNDLCDAVKDIVPTVKLRGV